MVALESATAHRAFVNDAFITILASCKRFVFAVLAWALSRKHLGATLLCSILRRRIFITEATRASLATSVVTPIISTRTPSVVPSRATIRALTPRLPLTPRTTATFPSRATIRALTTRLPLTPRTTATFPSWATIRALTTRLPFTPRATPVIASAATPLTPLLAAIVVAIFGQFVLWHDSPTLRRMALEHDDVAPEPAATCKKPPLSRGFFV
jgi:hypothetical protein